MTSPRIDTYRDITPLIYSWRTPDVPRYAGWEKIGYTEQESADKRIAQQASQMSVTKEKVWSRRALFTTEGGGRFTDKDFHAYLRQQGVPRELKPKRTEWFDIAAMTPRTSLDYFNAFAGEDFSDLQTMGEEDYTLRPEQQSAVKQAIDAFNGGSTKVLWNAKPRFGKTLTAYDLMRELDVRYALIVTNRPAIANSWLDDFERFIGWQTAFKFVSESASLLQRSQMTRKQWFDFSAENQDNDEPRIIEFVSLQDLKGSEYFGGDYPKLRHIAEFDWDLLVVDEAHEGVDTDKTEVAFDNIHRKWTLHLSGTPFRALASGKFAENEIFNWTYEDEQTARDQWDDGSQDNPYASLPTLNLLAYQMSRMISDRIAEGVAVDEDSENIDYAFDLNEFFTTKENGYFEHEADVIAFLDRLSANDKYPFSTPELRDEIRHSFWLLDRVASVQALARLLKHHDVFKDYTVMVAAGDGRLDESDPVANAKSLDKVRAAIADAETNGGRTITLSVGQLTTGVTVPEWTAVMMLSNLSSAAQYMQAAFRAQNPCTFERAGTVYQKKNAYILDFAPERTLTIFDEFANNLNPNPSNDADTRRDNIRRLLNFFPVIGEDADGTMKELDASETLTFPQVFKAREVVRRGFMSNLLFANVAGIFRYSEHLKEILDKLPTAKQGHIDPSATLKVPIPPIPTDAAGNATANEIMVNEQAVKFGTPVWDATALPPIEPDVHSAAIAQKVVETVSASLEAVGAEYGMTQTQVERERQQLKHEVISKVERTKTDFNIEASHLRADLADAPTEADAEKLMDRIEEAQQKFAVDITALATAIVRETVPNLVNQQETKKERKRATDAMEDARSHLRGFARTIPMFLMAYGDADMRLANFDTYTDEAVFLEVTGITQAEFRTLRDGQTVTEEGGTVVKIPGLFDGPVFDQSITEFLAKKAELADYFDESRTEDIFAYIPQQKTSLVFTPQPVVTMMVDSLEAENPGIFSDPAKTHADLFSKAGVFLMELVRRLDKGLADQIPNRTERLKHIFTKQLFALSPSTILNRITVEAVSGGDDERRGWIEDSGHFKIGELAKMTPTERDAMVANLLGEEN